MSLAHQDAGKFATWIKVVSGAKLWFMLDRDAADNEVPGNLMDIDYSAYKWTG
jgi:hypothetical protein